MWVVSMSHGDADAAGPQKGMLRESAEVFLQEPADHPLVYYINKYESCIKYYFIY